MLRFHKQVFKLMQKEHDTSWGFPEDKSIYTKCRKSAIDKLSTKAFENDTIILIENIPNRRYYCSIYESNNNNVNVFSYIFADKSESLKCVVEEDSILIMAKNNQLEEIKRRGDKSRLTPPSWLIVNILTKENKKKFRIKTVKTLDFLTYKDYGYLKKEY